MTSSAVIRICLLFVSPPCFLPHQEMLPARKVTISSITLLFSFGKKELVKFYSCFLPHLLPLRCCQGQIQEPYNKALKQNRTIYIQVLSSSSEKELLFQRLKFTFCTIFSLDYSLCSFWSVSPVLLTWGKNVHGIADAQQWSWADHHHHTSLPLPAFLDHNVHRNTWPQRQKPFASILWWTVHLMVSVIRTVDSGHLGRVPKEYNEPDMVCICMKMQILNLKSLNNTDKKTKYNSNITTRQLWEKGRGIRTKKHNLLRKSLDFKQTRFFFPEDRLVKIVWHLFSSSSMASSLAVSCRDNQHNFACLQVAFKKLSSRIVLNLVFQMYIFIFPAWSHVERTHS